MKDARIETAWLIEYTASAHGQVTYYGKTLNGLGATAASLDALRFSRKEDAEEIILEFGWTEAKATEHMFGLTLDTTKGQEKDEHQ